MKEENNMIKKFEIGKKYKCIKEILHSSVHPDYPATVVGEIYKCTYLYEGGCVDPKLESSTDIVVCFEDINHRDSILEYFVDASKADLVFTAETLKVGDKLKAVKPSSSSASLHFSWKTIKNEVYRIATIADRKLTLYGLWKQNTNNALWSGTEEFYMDQMNLDIEAGCYALIVEKPGIDLDAVNKIEEKVNEIETLLGD